MKFHILILKTRQLLAALLVLAAISLSPNEAAADWSPLDEYSRDDLVEYMHGIGTDHLLRMGLVYMPRSVIGFEEDPQNPPIKGSGYMNISLSALPFPTVFGALGGFEADMTLGFPLGKSYFGGLGADAGIVLQPVSFRHLRASVAFGAGFNAHAYGYLKPRIAFTIVPGWVDAEATYRLIPEYTSNIFGGKDDGLEDKGFGEQRFHGSIFIHTGSKKSGGKALDPTNAVELSFDYVRVKGDAKELERVRLRSGDYMGFGLGFAM